MLRRDLCQGDGDCKERYMALASYMPSLIQRNLTLPHNSRAALTHFVTALTANMTYVFSTFIFDSDVEIGTSEIIGGMPRTLAEEARARRFSSSRFYQHVNIPFYFGK